MERSPGVLYPQQWDDPEDIVDGALNAQRKLLSGYGGNPKAKEHFQEGLNPNQTAISLDGEPAMYPKLLGLLKSFHARGFTTFVVTNGQFPERLEEIARECPPAQLYVSFIATSEQQFKKINIPVAEANWQNLMKTFDLMRETLNRATRTVVRVTLIKGKNDFDASEYAEILKRAQPDFIEVKSFMAVGSSRLRGLGIENMMSHEEIRAFAEKLAQNLGELGYKVAAEQPISRVVLLDCERKNRFINRADYAQIKKRDDLEKQGHWPVQPVEQLVSVHNIKLKRSKSKS